MYRGVTYCEVKETTEENMSEWIDYFMNAFNTATDGVPTQQIQTREGLEKVLTVVEALNNR